MATVSITRKHRKPGALYFPIVTLMLAGLSFLAFSDNLITDVGQPSNSDPRMVVHGLFAAAWILLFTAQAWLIYLGRIALHRRIGTWVFVVGAAMAAATLYLFVSKFRGWSVMSPEVLANRLLLPVFVICGGLAYWRRNRADWHKRLLLIGTMALLEPVLARVYDPLLGPFLPRNISAELDTALFFAFLFGSWTALVGSLWIYDRITIGRVHTVTARGSAAIAAVNLFAYLR